MRGIFEKLPTELDFFHRRFDNDGLFETVNGRNVCRWIGHGWDLSPRISSRCILAADHGVEAFLPVLYSWQRLLFFEPCGRCVFLLVRFSSRQEEQILQFVCNSLQRSERNYARHHFQKDRLRMYAIAHTRLIIVIKKFGTQRINR